MSESAYAASVPRLRATAKSSQNTSKRHSAGVSGESNRPPCRNSIATVQTTRSVSPGPIGAPAGRSSDAVDSSRHRASSAYDIMSALPGPTPPQPSPCRQRGRIGPVAPPHKGIAEACCEGYQGRARGCPCITDYPDGLPWRTVQLKPGGNRPGVYGCGALLWRANTAWRSGEFSSASSPFCDPQL